MAESVENLVGWVQDRLGCPTVVVTGTELARKQVLALTGLSLASLFQPFNGRGLNTECLSNRRAQKCLGITGVPVIGEAVKRGSRNVSVRSVSSRSRALHRVDGDGSKLDRLGLDLTATITTTKTLGWSSPRNVKTKTCDAFRVRFDDVENAEPPDERVYLSTMSRVVKSFIVPGETKNFSMQDEGNSSAAGCLHCNPVTALLFGDRSTLCDWYEGWLDTVCASTRWIGHNTMAQPIGSICVVTSYDPDPTFCFHRLMHASNLPSLCQKGIYDCSPTQALIYLDFSESDYDTSIDPSFEGEKGVDKFERVAASFPREICFRLVLGNCKKCEPKSQLIKELFYTCLPVVFQSDMDVSSCCLENNQLPENFVKYLCWHDLHKIRDCMREFILGRCTHWIEDKIRELETQINVSKKGFRNQIKSFLRRPRGGVAELAGGAAEAFISSLSVNSGSEKEKIENQEMGGGSSYSYVAMATSTEWQTRLLGDLYFFVGEYTNALNCYRNAASEFRADPKRMMYLASCLEMCGVCTLLTNPSNSDIANTFLSQAYSYYIKSGKFDLACVCTMLSHHLLFRHNPHDDENVASCGHRLLKLNSVMLRRYHDPYANIVSAILLEQAADCFGKTGKRKSKFQLVLAGHTYAMAGLTWLAIRCYTHVLGEYKKNFAIGGSLDFDKVGYMNYIAGNGDWHSVAEHIHLKLVKNFLNLGDIKQAEYHIVSILNLLAEIKEFNLLSTGAGNLIVSRHKMTSNSAYLRFKQIVDKEDGRLPSRTEFFQIGELGNPEIVLRHTAYMEELLKIQKMREVNNNNNNNDIKREQHIEMLRIPIIYARDELGNFRNSVFVFIEDNDYIPPLLTSQYYENIQKTLAVTTIQVNNKVIRPNPKLPNFNQMSVCSVESATLMVHHRTMDSKELALNSRMLDSEYGTILLIYSELTQTTLPNDLFAPLEFTKTLNSRQFPVGANLIVEFTLINPLALPLPLKNIHVKCNNEDDIESEVLPFLLLDPHISQTLRLRITPLSEGEFKIIGVCWTVLDTLEVFHPILVETIPSEQNSANHKNFVMLPSSTPLCGEKFALHSTASNNAPLKQLPPKHKDTQPLSHYYFTRGLSKQIPLPLGCCYCTESQRDVSLSEVRAMKTEQDSLIPCQRDYLPVNNMSKRWDIYRKQNPDNKLITFSALKDVPWIKQTITGLPSLLSKNKASCAFVGETFLSNLKIQNKSITPCVIRRIEIIYYPKSLISFEKSETYKLIDALATTKEETEKEKLRKKNKKNFSDRYDVGVVVLKNQESFYFIGPHRCDCELNPGETIDLGFRYVASEPAGIQRIRFLTRITSVCAEDTDAHEKCTVVQKWLSEEKIVHVIDSIGLSLTTFCKPSNNCDVVYFSLNIVNKSYTHEFQINNIKLFETESDLHLFVPDLNKYISMKNCKDEESLKKILCVPAYDSVQLNLRETRYTVLGFRPKHLHVNWISRDFFMNNNDDKLQTINNLNFGDCRVPINWSSLDNASIPLLLSVAAPQRIPLNSVIPLTFMLSKISSTEGALTTLRVSVNLGCQVSFRPGIGCPVVCSPCTAENREELEMWKNVGNGDINVSESIEDISNGIEFVESICKELRDLSGPRISFSLKVKFSKQGLFNVNRVVFNATWKGEPISFYFPVHHFVQVHET